MLLYLSVNEYEAIFETFHCMRAALPCCRPSRSMATPAVAGRVDVEQHRDVFRETRHRRGPITIKLSTILLPRHPKDPRVLVNHRGTGLDCRWIHRPYYITNISLICYFILISASCITCSR